MLNYCVLSNKNINNSHLVSLSSLHRLLLYIFFTIAIFIPLKTSAQSNTETPSYVKKGFSIPLSFGVGAPIHKTTLGGNDEVSVSSGGGLLIGTGLFYNTLKNLKLGGTLRYHATEVKQVDEQGSSSFSRFVISPIVKVPVQLNPNSFINFGGGYGFFLNGKMELDAAGPSKITGKTNYEDETGLHFLTEYEENFHSGYISIGIKYYNVKYSYRSGDNFLPQMNGSGLDFYINYSFRI